MLLYDKQKEIILSPARFKIVRAGRRSGKTTLETEEMAFEAVEESNRPIFYIAPTQTQARSIVWEIFKKRFHNIAEFNEQRMEIKVPTQDGQFNLIKLAGWENRENFRGLSAYHIVFDELDTMKDFFIGWQEIFRPALIDRGGKATFIGTPKKENPNLRRLERKTDPQSKEYDKDYASFHFTSNDNPFLPEDEKVKAKEELDFETYQQEIMANYLDNQGALFKYEALLDTFSNTIVKSSQRYMIVDVADDGSDKTTISCWEGLEEYKREAFEHLNSEAIIAKVKETASLERIPYSNICVDAIGVGSSVASSSFLDGIIGYKSSYAPIKTDMSIVQLPNVHYLDKASLTSDYKNLRSQCVFTLAEMCNTHQIASRVTGQFKEMILEELQCYQDASIGDGKRFATPKEDVKEIIGRSPDHSDTWIMRMYFVIRDNMLPGKSESLTEAVNAQKNKFNKNKANQIYNSAK